MKWEYRTLKIDVRGFWGAKVDESRIDGVLNEVGADGWELVTALDINILHGQSSDLVFVFKRPVER